MKSVIESKNKWTILAGIFVGLTITSRIIGIALILPILTIWLFNIFYFKKRINLKKEIILIIFLLLTVSPLIIKTQQHSFIIPTCH